MLGKLLGEPDVRLVQVADALGDAQVIVVPPVALQILGGAPQLRHRLDEVVLPRILLAETDPGRDVVRVEIDELLERVEACLGVARLLVEGGDRLPLLGRVAHQPELLVQLGKADVHFDALDDLQHLLIERHRLEVEPLLRIGPGDLLEAVRRLGLAVHLLVELGELLQDPDVVRIELQDALVFLDRFVERTLRDQLRGRLD